MAESSKTRSQETGEWPEYVVVKVETEKHDSLEEEPVAVKEEPIDEVTSATGLANPLVDAKSEFIVQVKEEILDDEDGGSIDDEDVEMEATDIKEEQPQTSRAGASSDTGCGTTSSEMQYACEFCDYMCSRTNHLTAHMRTHTGEKPYDCDFCDYKCSRKDVLKKHVRTHSGEKPYACKVCDYKCAEAVTLRRHSRIHTGEKPYACELCDCTFTRTDHLKKHRRIHTGEKLHSCDYCHRSFSRSDYMKKHMRTHTREKPVGSFQAC